MIKDGFIVCVLNDLSFLKKFGGFVWDFEGL